MKMKNEQQMAKHMLIHHQRGYSVLRFLRRSVWRYVLIPGVFAAILVVFLRVGGPFGKLGFAWGLGMLGGAALRDVVWFRGIRRSWPFREKITDWAKVEAIAAGECSATDRAESTDAGRNP